MKLKETLNLGKTAFPMRAGLPNKEPQWQAAWEQAELYKKRQELNAGKPAFHLHDGPPYANGNIHVGHALNKISKDIIVRSKSMSGFQAPYVPGWDTHGLPIEQVLAKQGIKRKEMDLAEYLEMCRQYALSQVDKQRDDFKRLGVSADWENPYVTLDPQFEADQIRVFGAMAEKGYIYRGAKPVYWSWSSESALAEAEIEYHDIDSTSLYYANKVKDGKGILDTNTYIVVWTTTPFTVTASRGLTVGPDMDYLVVKPAGSDRQYVVAEGLLDSLAGKFGWESFETLASHKGADLEYIVTEHPWDTDVEELVILGDHVTLESGTGIVHTAPGFGEDDYNVGTKYKLEVAVTVDERGLMMENAGPDFHGQFYNKVTPIVIDKLGDLLLAQEVINHSYPFDWRTKKPIIWRAVPQWFASVSDFRQDILDEIEKTTFHPSWGETRLYNMIRDRGDWVISRQRAWGVPLPIFYAEDGTAIMTKEVTDHVADLFQENGSIIWWQKEAKDLLPEGFTHPGSPNGEFTKETDIMDVWFDSGSSWNGVMNARENLSYPADLYLEGSDQYRGWFNSSLITSVAVNGHAPYKAILSQGFVLDGKGEKMSKSKGNIISPNDVAKQYGADILRLWVASVDTDNDIRVSMEILGQVSETYRKIRNTLRFLIANTSDFNPATDTVAYADLGAVDKYMTIVFNQLVATITDAYERYDFMAIYKAVVNFVTVDLSAFYLDFAKDVVYIEAANSLERRRMQTVFYDILVKITKLLTPILPHTTEEIWSYLEYESEAFVQLAEMPVAETFSAQEDILEAWSAFMTLRTQAQKALEEARNAKIIGKSLEAHLTIYASEEVKTLLTALDSDIALLLIVSQLTIADLADAPADAVAFEGVAFMVEHAIGEVCERSRRIDPTTRMRSYNAFVCDHSAKIIEENFPEAVAEGFEESGK
ncbi:TPA: isoleucine--tRNA ligase [Streptococcus pyogenes]|uniref:Isoleucine--tRNA ligase n=1 Tax=Streptococcus pyogenes serotype M12 (strain MGAS9429) TaxID=370551 RepID=Q1JKZ4_STRPC|nr:isoleucine--tRNA ligase [Streptococcus pyogenes]ABF36313.1 Isoleucyl-tRNA synthetase [Streptococcus pyogenes MGAS2096]EZM57706.1 isoleucyl-tRNA synthetase [Streptococcus pyogenes ABC020046230]HEP6152762.1 isoleucine--tRNA ligase [Streptococcus pyogenes ABC020047615]HEP6175016.1 isoleucine--tRNA ligase [Streptococcus pyogenes ABC020056755]HEP6180347.1 isoleucine--tRNA ligase [Streptococcus pyogenes ABC020057019]HEP6183817.1 isoleucine--tRNA ligase [Streptococcus pyogenes ABC020061794]HEP61